MADDDKKQVNNEGSGQDRNFKWNENIRQQGEGSGREAFKPAQYYTPETPVRPKEDPPGTVEKKE